MQTVEFHDATRDRTLTTDIYLPDGTDRVPLILMSNGLGARRDLLAELAENLASYGFAVAVPDHPGSDRQRLLDFYHGLYSENFAASEYVDRPLDISFLLDTLQARHADWGDRLNFDQVGVFGYSFGGTTALSLAGATFDRAHLQHDCNTRLAAINISLLYQCRALELPENLPNLRDQRIKAIFALVPFGRSLFGPEGMRSVQIPVFWEATDQDILTPLMVEQIPAYRWLTTPDKYLAVSQGLPHARLTLDVINRLTHRAIAWDDIRPIVHRYQNALSVAFFKVYVAGDEGYQPFLQSSYAEQLTEPPYRLNLVRSLPEPADH